MQAEKFTYSDNRGQLLLEIIVVIGVMAIIGALVSQLVLASLNSTKWSTQDTVAVSLSDEEIEAVKSVSFEKWQNIYNLNKTATDHYHASKLAGAWKIYSSEEVLALNISSYARYFTVSNVCRDNTTQAIITRTGACSGNNSDDPSTQKITVSISWIGGVVVKDFYLTRWRNQTCVQTSWTGIGSGTTTCPSTNYESATSIDSVSTPGSLKLQAN